MTHHNVSSYRSNIIHYCNSNYVSHPYGVSRAMRAISPQTLVRKHNHVVNFMASILGLTANQREVVLRLLQLWVHYGTVYPKERQISELPGCSKATFWRTVALLKAKGLITIVNRYVVREKAQISNLYNLEKLILAIAKYLAEHGHKFTEDWLKPILEMDWRAFWRTESAAALSPP